MSTFSHEDHVRAPQQAILEHMESFFQAQAYQSFEIASLPQDMKERETFTHTLYRAPVDRLFYLVSPTDAHDWTILWSNGDYYNERLIAFLSEQLQTTAIYGHDNDQVDDWHWILFQEGKEVASYWYLGFEDQMWVNYPDRYEAPPGAITLRDAFEAQGRTYHHQSLSLAVVYGWSITGLPLDQFRFVSISDRSGTIAQK